MSAPIRSLLVIKPSSLGDIIHSLIVLQTVKDRHPDLQIDFVVRDRFADLPLGASCVDHVIPFERTAGIGGFYRIVKAVRQKRYDMVWDMQGLFRSGLIMGLAKSHRKIGRADSRESSGCFATERVKLPSNGSPHAVDKLLQYLPSLGIEPVPGTQVRLKSPPLESIDGRLKNTRPIVMIPHSRGKEKEWPGFEALTRELLGRGLTPPIVWDSHQHIETRALDKNPAFINTSGKTSVAQMVSLIQSASLVVANDCGPMHLACAFQKPTIAIFGPTTFEQFGAYPIDHPRNANLQAEGGDWSKLPLETVTQTALRLLQA